MKEWFTAVVIASACLGVFCIGGFVGTITSLKMMSIFL